VKIVVFLHSVSECGMNLIQAYDFFEGKQEGVSLLCFIKISVNMCKLAKKIEMLQVY
jgi:Na+/H+ antiporter NhaA